MNRNKLKQYAPKARREFIKAVTDRAADYGLTKDKIAPVEVKGDVAIIGGKPFPKDAAEKRERLEERIRREGFEQVMEAMAYTWFNRFAAIRFMEVHGYLDHGYRVFSTTDYTDDTDGKKDKKKGTTNHTNGTNLIPDILRYAEHVELAGVDRERVVELKLAGNKDEELYRMLLVGQCNALHKAMPFLFERIGDATELLLPENLLHSDSLIRRMVNEVPEEEWQEVEILGWLYQFYISEKKDQVIGKVVKSEDIPAATQLFTPNWIVKYMVQNTIGRMWLATYPDSPLRKLMEYYIEPGEQTPEVMEQMRAMTPEGLNPEEMTLADVACGSGHILVEGYDLFKAIYQERGYRAKDIPKLILEKNLFGLEIDDRAAQLAAFALMMKARADDRRIFERGVKLNVLAIQNSPELDDEALKILTTDYTDTTDMIENEESVSIRDIRVLLELFGHGKTFGSLIRVPEEIGDKLPVIAERVEDMLAHGDIFGRATAEAISPIVQQARILAGRYDASVTNPPYMGSGAMPPELKRFAIDQCPDSKSDLFAMFVERNLELLNRYGRTGMITMQSWMFLSYFERLRQKLLENHTISSMAHLGARAFDSIGGEVVSTTAFVLQRIRLPDHIGVYIRLVDGKSEAEKKAAMIESRQNLKGGLLFYASAVEFSKIPGGPIAYWPPKKIFSIFENKPSVRQIASPKQGSTIGDNDRFLRLWFEIRSPLSKAWKKTVKGGDYRRWYGNNAFIVNWGEGGNEIESTGKATIRNSGYLFKKGIEWSRISTSNTSFRLLESGYFHESASGLAFPKERELSRVLGLFNSVPSIYFLSLLNPTLTFQSGDIARIPFASAPCDNEVEKLVKISRSDWDSHETSWDFIGLPMLNSSRTPRLNLAHSYEQFRFYSLDATFEAKSLEEENNRIFIEAYGLQDELTPDVPISEITLTCNPHYRYGPGKSEEELEALLRADTIKELVSYAVGCMMGRYSLDAPGLIYAHSGNHQFWEIYHEKHNQPIPSLNNQCHPCDPWSKFPPDADGIIPITDIDWFPDDAANRFIQFISVAWPKEHLEENLKFLADSLSPKKSETPRESIRRYMATGFFKHYMKMYKKRPIYWLFTSGKLRAFQCLVYLHRYNEGTLSRMRTEYVIPLQGKFAARIEQLSGDIDAATSTAHRKKLEREKEKLQKQRAELQAFDEKLRHYADQRISLDLDDGVKVNYGKFGDLLAEVKAVTGKA